jgi:hypothetical protein
MLYSSYVNIIQSSDEESGVIYATILFIAELEAGYCSHVLASSMPHASFIEILITIYC